MSDLLEVGQELVCRRSASGDCFTVGRTYTIQRVDIGSQIPYMVSDNTCDNRWLKLNLRAIGDASHFEVKEEPTKEYLKVGDKLVCSIVHPYDGVYFTNGKEYAIREVDMTDARLTYLVETNRQPQWVRTEQDHFAYGSAVLTPVPSEQYLTPLEVVESFFKGEDVEYLYKGTWVHLDFNCSLDFVRQHPFRKQPLIPKTMEINGVTVPAPLSKKPENGTVYTVAPADERVVALYYQTTLKHVWATEEDAQKVLDAILIPFKNLNAS